MFLNGKIPILCILFCSTLQTVFGQSIRPHPVVLLLLLDHDSRDYSPGSSALDLSERPAGINTPTKNVKSFHSGMFSPQESRAIGSHIGLYPVGQS